MAETKKTLPELFAEVREALDVSRDLLEISGESSQMWDALAALDKIAERQIGGGCYNMHNIHCQTSKPCGSCLALRAACKGKEQCSGT